jgi:hypothetical protein
MESGNGGNLMKAGDYQLESLIMYSLPSGDNINIRYLFSYMEVYEDIYSPCITAKIHMNDGLNISEFLPIRGQELVELVFRTDVDGLESVKLLFRVYKIDSHHIEPNSKSQRYTLHLISEGGYFNFTERCGYAVGGKVSDMVNTVMTRHFPEQVWKDRLDVEGTKHDYSFVLSAHQNPFRAINWLCSKAVSKTDGSYSPFMFFETLDGYKFKSLASIMQDAATNNRVIKYFYNTGNLMIGGGVPIGSPFVVEKTPLPPRYDKVQKLEELSRFDMVSNFMDGKVSSMLVVHDLMKKQQRTINFKELDGFEDIPKTGSKNHFQSKDPQAEKIFTKPATMDYFPVTPYTAYSVLNPVVDNMRTEDIYLKRRFQMNSLLSGQKVMIEVFGDSRRRVGDIVDLYIPKVQADAQLFDDPIDKNLGGKYLVTSIKHIFNMGYTCKMELSKSFLGV